MEYIDLDTNTPYSDHKCAIIDSYKQSLIDGSAFATVVLSERSVNGYRPTITRREWSYCMGVISRMAAESDELAQIANTIIGRINLYGTSPEAKAQVFTCAGEALRKGFDDVHGRYFSGGIGRSTDYHRDYDLVTRILLMVWLKEATAPMSEGAFGLGWCLVALARAEHIHIPYHDFTYIKP
jgi:hypothetical protein